MPSKTIVRQIEEVEHEISGCEKRLDHIEKSLRLKRLTEDQRQSLQEEDKRMKKQLSSHKKELSELRRENRKSMVVSVILLGLCFIIYVTFWKS